MKIFISIAVGVVGGIIGGMGMGGGGLLIPLLSLFLSVGQKDAQACNLIAFIPMSVIATIMHAKNKMIDFRFWYVSLFAVVGSILSSLLALRVNSHLLRIFFGIFLCVVGILNVISAFKERSKQKGKLKQKTKSKQTE